MHVSRLALTDFRSYAAALVAPGPGFVLLHGDNGAGKTNLLEAISLLGPGRGLRGARISEVAQLGIPVGGGAWSVSGHFDDGLGGFEIGTGSLEEGSAERRAFRLDGEKIRAQAELAERSGVDYKHIQLLEGKTAPSVRLDTLEKICLGFGLKLHEFFDDLVFTHADRIAISGKTKASRK